MEIATGSDLSLATPSEPVHNRVPRVTVGEPAADLLNVKFGLGLSTTSWVMGGVPILETRSN